MIINCKKCPHYSTCTRLCYPVKQILKEKGEAFERGGIIYPLHKQIPLSVCLKPSHDGKESPNDEEKLLSTELESPFKSFRANLKITYCFIHRFFLKDSFKDIGDMLGISNKSAEVLYREAVKKILVKLKDVDRDGRKTVAENHYKKVFRNKANNIPKNKKWWIMCNYFGMTPSEVAEMENTTGRNVSSVICRFDAQVKAEKVTF